MQIPPKPNPAALLGRLVADALPERRGFDPWRALLRAHATLIRRLDTDLEQNSRALISRSGMTRRVARLVDERMVRRANVDADGRGVLVALTETGLLRLAETAPVHLGAVAELFVAKLDDEELDALERAMAKVTVECSFG